MISLTKRLLAASIVILLSLGGVSACAYLQQLVGVSILRPKANLKTVEVTKVSFNALELLVTLSIENPNDFMLGLDHMDYRVLIAGLEVANGQFKEDFEVASESSADIRLPFRVDTDVVMKVLKLYMEKPKELKAVLDGVVNFKTPLGSIETTFREEKKISGIGPA